MTRDRISLTSQLLPSQFSIYPKPDVIHENKLTWHLINFTGYNFVSVLATTPLNLIKIGVWGQEICVRGQTCFDDFFPRFANEENYADRKCLRDLSG